MGEWSRPISILQLTDICLDLVNGLRKTGLHLCAIFVYGFCFPPAPLQLPGFKPVYIFHVVSVNWVWILAYVLFWSGHCFFITNVYSSWKQTFLIALWVVGRIQSSAMWFLLHSCPSSWSPHTEIQLAQSHWITFR